MSEQETLLRAIRDDPEDDAVRLVYADWLLERGGRENEARAELIRVQIRLERSDEDDPDRTEWRIRESELLQEYGERWKEGVGEHVALCAIRRGFVEEVTLTASQFLDHGELLFEKAPITGVQISVASEAIPQLASSPLLGRVRHLCLRELNGLDAPQLALLLSSNLCQVRTLDLTFQHLQALGAGLLAKAVLPKLTCLVLDQNLLRDEGVQELARPPWMGRLTQLDLCANGLGPAAVEALAAAPTSTALTTLNLRHNSIGRTGALLLAESSSLAGLTTLGLGFDLSEIGDSGLGFLAGSPHLKRLTRLDLSSNDIHSAGAVALANSEGMACLTVLDLYHNTIGTTGAEALARSPHLRRLTHLNLNGNGIDPEGVEALAQSPNVRHIREMDLRGNYPGRSGAKALANSPHLDAVTCLWLDDGLQGKEMLAQRFGRRVRFT